MSVNIYDGTNLIPIAGKTVPAPTPDYVDEQYNSSTTYSKGMTCISGNVRYRYKNSTASSGHQPPNATYWEELSVSDELGGTVTFTRNTALVEKYVLSATKVGNLCSGNLVVNRNSGFAKSSWHEVGTLSEIPVEENYGSLTVGIKFPLIIAGSGVYAGMAAIDNTGKVMMYVTEDNAFSISIPFSFRIS